MSINLYGALRTNTNLNSNSVTYSSSGTQFQISSYTQITITDGADATQIAGDNFSNENPNDSSQTLNGEVIAWDYTIEVSDGTNTYHIGVFDYDLNGDGDFDYPSSEQGYFLGFLDGEIPPLNTTLTIVGIVENDNWIPTDTAVPCFVSGTLIDTPQGPRAIDDLVPGDKVLTMDNGAQPIRWVGCKDVSQRELKMDPKLKPIRIVSGALGHGLPKRDLFLSPQHRVLIRSPIAQRIFGVNETLIAAKKLVDIPGIFVDGEATSVSYYHMLFDNHEVVFSEGAPSESLYTGQEALKSIGDEAREEVLTLFPELGCPDFTPVAARHIPQKGKHVRDLVGRHIKNQKPLLTHL